MKPKVIRKQSNKQAFLAYALFASCITSLYIITYNGLVYGISTTQNFLTYTNSDYGFTIKYPSNWVVDETNITGMTRVKFHSPDHLAGILVDVRNLRPNETGMSLDNISQILVAKHQYVRLLEINRENYFLSGYPAIWSVGITPHDIKTMMLFTIIGGKFYGIAYLSPSETYTNYLPLAQEMIDSFQVISRK